MALVKSRGRQEKTFPSKHRFSHSSRKEKESAVSYTESIRRFKQSRRQADEGDPMAANYLRRNEHQPKQGARGAPHPRGGRTRARMRENHRPRACDRFRDNTAEGLFRGRERKARDMRGSQKRRDEATRAQQDCMGGGLKEKRKQERPDRLPPRNRSGLVIEAR